MTTLGPTDVLFWFLVLCGLGLFIYGIATISKVLKRMAGNGLRKVMEKCSSNRFKGFLTGTLFTAVIQSSGGTTALTIGMVRAGVLTLVAAAPIIIGANVGTTVTAFIISIPVIEYLSIFVFLGGFVVLLFSKKKWQNIGELCFSFGCIFFGLWIMASNLTKIATDSATASAFNNIMSFLMGNPWLGLLIGALLTAALQSSSAVIGVVQSLYTAAIAASISSGNPSTITLFGCLPILFGANVGTTITALISSIGGSKEAKRVAFFHLIYNVTGALLFMGVIYIVKPWLESSPSWKLEPSFQLALSHLIFNVVTAAIFMAILKPVCALSEKIIPGEDRKGSSIVIKELDSNVMREFPSEGIALGKEQIISMFGYTKMMFETIGQYLDTAKGEDGEFVHEIEQSVDRIDRQMNEYLLVSDKGDLSSTDVASLTKVLRACKDIERIGDYGENLITFFEEASEKNQKVSGEFKETFLRINSQAVEFIGRTIEAFQHDNKEQSLSIIKERRKINEDIDNLIANYFDSVSSSKEKSEGKYMEFVYVDILNNYQRVFSHCSNIAKLYGTDKKYTYDFADETKLENMTHRY